MNITKSGGGETPESVEGGLIVERQNFSEEGFVQLFLPSHPH